MTGAESSRAAATTGPLPESSPASARAAAVGAVAVSAGPASARAFDSTGPSGEVGTDGAGSAMAARPAGGVLTLASSSEPDVNPITTGAASVSTTASPPKRASSGSTPGRRLVGSGAHDQASSSWSAGSPSASKGTVRSSLSMSPKPSISCGWWLSAKFGWTGRPAVHPLDSGTATEQPIPPTTDRRSESGARFRGTSIGRGPLGLFTPEFVVECRRGVCVVSVVRHGVRSSEHADRVPRPGVAGTH